MKTKNMINLKGIALLVFILALTAAGSSAKMTSTSEAVIIHNISIDKETKEILVDASLAIDQGILEYLLVGTEGKAYESVLTLKNNKPSELNVALLLIGCRAFPFDRLKNYMENNTALEEWQHELKDSSLEISFKIDDTRYPLEALISSREESSGDLVWIYTGGQVVEHQGYKADNEHSYIAIWPDPVCSINLFSKTQNPYKGDFGFEINPKIQVKKNTRIQIIIRKKAMTTKTKGLAPPKTASELLDMYYLEARSHLLETAAILDRIERGAGAPATMADPRIQKLFDACDILKDRKTNRAEQFLNALSV